MIVDYLVVKKNKHKTIAIVWDALGQENCDVINSIFGYVLSQLSRLFGSPKNFVPVCVPS